MLVRRGELPDADAIGWRRLPLPGLFAEDGSPRRERAGRVTLTRLVACYRRLARTGRAASAASVNECAASPAVSI